jgi:hypothetical protein
VVATVRWGQHEGKHLEFLEEEELAEHEDNVTCVILFVFDVVSSNKIEVSGFGFSWGLRFGFYMTIRADMRRKALKIGMRVLLLLLLLLLA